MSIDRMSVDRMSVDRLAHVKTQTSAPSFQTYIQDRGRAVACRIVQFGLPVCVSMYLHDARKISWRLKLDAIAQGNATAWACTQPHSPLQRI